MKNILDKIVAAKRKEVEEKKSLYPTKLLEKSIFFPTGTVSLKKYLLRKDKSGIIAEFKRKSPSKGMINEYASVEQVTIGYMMAGASALSVLTDQQFFGGSSVDLEIAREFNYCPILRKDFIIDEYQILEAKSIGADAILLIASILDQSKIALLAEFAMKLGLEVLLEIHDKEEIKKVTPEIDLLGINNRNLKTFEVDINSSLELLPMIPDHVVKVTESGINSPDKLLTLKSAGFQGFLMGEYFMRFPLPAKACEEFINKLKTRENEN